MKEIRSKKGSKQIICIMVMIMLCNFIVPNYSYAVSTEGGASALEVISQFICFIPDAVIEFLQDMFVSPTDIKISAANYQILYSPGTIFAGKIPAFDINFIEPKDSITVQEEDYSMYLGNLDKATAPVSTVFEKLKNNRIHSGIFSNIGPPGLGGEWLGWPGKWKEILSDYYYNVSDYQGTVYIEDPMEWVDPSWFLDVGEWVLGGYEQSSFYIYGDKAYFIMSVEITVILATYYEYAVYEATLTDEELKFFEEQAKNGEYDFNHEQKVYDSSASILQNTVATWYNALRRIALVGLLSVLLYLGIRIVLTSTSAKDKAKYKAMLKDWLIALCILFTLHYVMSITITVVGKINEIIGASAIGQNGEDILMSKVRSDIGKGENWGSVLAYVAIYCVLAVYTVIFTIQYIRRVIYLAFLTMIAPLITLTYPLDKLKDKKAQAFDMWLKDYIFFSLLQVLHLLIYYVFLSSSLNLAHQGNWLYAIVAIGFMTKAEKLMKKMFGFEKSKSMGALAAGATGALVMNAINQIKGIGGKGAKTGGGSASGGGSSNSNVRTATNNPLSGLQGVGVSGPTGGGTPTGGPTGSSSSSSGAPTGGPGGGNNPLTSGTPTRSASSRGRRATSNSKTGKGSKFGNKLKRGIKGTAKVIGRYYKPVAKGVFKAGLGVGLGVTGGMIGFAAGVSQGDIKAAVSGALAGKTAGVNLGKGAVNLVTNAPKEVKNTINNVRDTYNEGAYGEEYANNVKHDREFRNSSAYQALRRESELEDKVFDERISQMLDSGITDTKRMKKILKNNEKHPRKYSMERAIAYSEMAEKCPDTILHDNGKFVRYCHDHDIDISEEELEKLRNCIFDFK